MPYPFSRGVFVFGPAITIASDASPDDLERHRSDLEAALNRLTSEAEAAVSRSGT